MSQICVRFNSYDYSAIEELAKDQNTTKPRIIQSMVGDALAARGMGLAEISGAKPSKSWLTALTVPEDTQVEKLQLQLLERENKCKTFEQQLRDNELKSTMCEQQLRAKEEELGFMRQEFSKINDALTQRTLTDGQPKKSFWDRFRRSK